ncbi:hypothetical protein CGCSCA5_v007510 [Colletotrichum siamense]|nr:hypothetical protein CGCSCA5_v007510 [Colletotrichum siamense]KAF4880115.1 hypothetical protein CGCSCA1_v000877 [Colletotrichum siamense]
MASNQHYIPDSVESARRTSTYVSSPMTLTHYFKHHDQVTMVIHSMHANAVHPQNASHERASPPTTRFANSKALRHSV